MHCTLLSLPAGNARLERMFRQLKRVLRKDRKLREESLRRAITLRENATQLRLPGYTFLDGDRDEFSEEEDEEEEKKEGGEQGE